MKYSIRLDFDTEKGRKQLMEKEGMSKTEVNALSDESHKEGMKSEITHAFGIPGDRGIAGFTGFEVL